MVRYLLVVMFLLWAAYLNNAFCLGEYNYGDNRAPSASPLGGLTVQNVQQFVTLGFDDNAASGWPSSTQGTPNVVLARHRSLILVCRNCLARALGLEAKTVQRVSKISLVWLSVSEHPKIDKTP